MAMILTDTDIEQLAASGGLQNHVPANIRNCGCLLTAIAAFDPGSGNERLLGDAADNTKPHFWELGPNETLVVMTRERVNIPPDLCASYTPLNRLAAQGIMLLNSAIVEPGYDGPLSCFLLNFSSKPVQIAEGEEISKIAFHTLTAAPKALQRQTLTTKDYKVFLSKSARRFHRSFLDVSGIEDRAAEKAQASAKKAVVFSGILIAFLLLWATLEPIASRWIWDKSTVISNQQRLDDAKLLKDIEAAKSSLGSATDVKNLELRSLDLQKDIGQIRQQLDALNTQLNNRRR
jgi:deoxycytidine triphosphate deaminase